MSRFRDPRIRSARLWAELKNKPTATPIGSVLQKPAASFTDTDLERSPIVLAAMRRAAEAGQGKPNTAQQMSAASAVENSPIVQAAMAMRGAAGQATGTEQAVSPLLAAVDALRRRQESRVR